MYSPTDADFNLRCFPGVQFSLRLFKLRVGDNKSISYIKVNEHLVSLVSLSQSK